MAAPNELEERLERWSSFSCFIREAGVFRFSDGWSFLPPDQLQVRLSLASRGWADLGTWRQSKGINNLRFTVFWDELLPPPDADMKGSVGEI